MSVKDDNAEWTKIKEIEHILPLVGEYGPFQRILDAIFFIINFSVTFQILIMTFSTFTPEWHCIINSTTCVWNGTFSGNDPRRCDIPRKSWEYLKPIEFSLVTTFDIDCDKKWILEIVTSIFFVGWAIGSIFLGWVADNYGRRNVYFLSTLIVLVVGFLSSFSPTITILGVCRFMIGFFFAASALQGFIMMSEIVGSKYRPFAGTIIFLSNPLAWSLLALISYLTDDWRKVSMLCTAPYIFVIVFYKFVPESIMWQLEKDKQTGVMYTLRRAAYWNKKELPPNLKFDFEKKSTCNSTPLDLFRNRDIAILSITQGLFWCFLAVGYLGIMMAANNLGGSVYSYFVLLNIGAILAFAISPYVCTRYGRKKGTLVPLFISSLICFSISCTPMEKTFVRIVLGILGKNNLDIGFYSMFIWASEIYPTRIRSTGIGYLEICGKIGNISAPWIANYLVRFGMWIPYTAMGGFLFIAFLIGLMISETHKTNDTRRSNDNSIQGADS